MKITIEKIVPSCFQLHIDGSNHYLSLDEMLTLSCTVLQRLANELTDPQNHYCRGQILRDNQGGIFVFDRVYDGSVYHLGGVTPDGRACLKPGRWSDVDCIAGIATSSEIQSFFNKIENK